MNRACETVKINSRIKDEKAVAIVKQLKVDMTKYDKLVTHECVIARTIMFDEKVKELINEYPNAIVLNIGCGLDDRFTRVDDGKIKWYDIDLAEMIGLRKNFYQDNERRKMIVADILNDEWTNIVKKQEDDMVIVIAEGLLMYFDKEQNRKIIENLVTNFNRGYLVAELMKQSMMNEKKHDTVKYTKATFGWGTDSAIEYTRLDNRLKLVSEESFSTQMMKSTFISRLIGKLTMKFNNRLAVFKWSK